MGRIELPSTASEAITSPREQPASVQNKHSFWPTLFWPRDSSRSVLSPSHVGADTNFLGITFLREGQVVARSSANTRTGLSFGPSAPIRNKRTPDLPLTAESPPETVRTQGLWRLKRPRVLISRPDQTAAQRGGRGPCTYRFRVCASAGLQSPPARNKNRIPGSCPGPSEQGRKRSTGGPLRAGPC